MKETINEINKDRNIQQHIELLPHHKKILEIVNELFPALENEISLNTDLNTVGLDSISFIRIIVALEEEYDFEFDDEMLDISIYKTIKDFIHYVDKKIENIN